MGIISFVERKGNGVMFCEEFFLIYGRWFIYKQEELF